ncbi:MAG: hypothetical protein GX113_10790 [Actinobacteria bacterium]|jgi:hypothetical protein|nr:hypothetical protein [Actinomycetota bacterium]
MEGLQHTARLRVRAENFWCEGDMVVPRPGAYKGRVHDILNGNEQFIALTGVVLHNDTYGEDDDPVTHDVLIMRKGAIEFVVPLD